LNGNIQKSDGYGTPLRLNEQRKSTIVLSGKWVRYYEFNVRQRGMIGRLAREAGTMLVFGELIRPSSSFKSR
jgi:hypothetical protein